MSSSRKMRRRLSVSSSESRVDRFRNMHGCTKQYYYYNNNDKKKDERYTVVSQIYCPLVSLLSSYLHSHFLPKRIISESQIKISVLRAWISFSYCDPCNNIRILLTMKSFLYVLPYCHFLCLLRPFQVFELVKHLGKSPPLPHTEKCPTFLSHIWTYLASSHEIFVKFILINYDKSHLLRSNSLLHKGLNENNFMVKKYTVCTFESLIICVKMHGACLIRNCA